LLPLGKRLEQKDPKDYAVKYLLRRLLSWSSSAEDRKLAVVYARDMVGAKPSEPAYRASLAGAYMNLWEKTRNPEDADKAIAAYREHLRVAPADAEFRSWAEHLIKVTEKEKADYLKAQGASKSKGSS